MAHILLENTKRYPEKTLKIFTPCGIVVIFYWFWPQYGFRLQYHCIIYLITPIFSHLWASFSALQSLILQVLLNAPLVKKTVLSMCLRSHKQITGVFHKELSV